MSNVEENKELPEGRRTEQLRRKLVPLLSAWYGEPEDSCVLMHHLPKTKPISEVMDSLGKTLYPKNVYLLTQIQTMWNLIAGSSAAKISKPLFFQEKILKVEVVHPAYLMSLNSRRAKLSMIEKMNEMFGEETCSEIQFVPAGRAGNLARKGSR